jgi:hypothetical protein
LQTMAKVAVGLARVLKLQKFLEIPPPYRRGH